MRSLVTLLLALSGACRVSDVKPTPEPPVVDPHADVAELCLTACEYRDKTLRCTPVIPNCASNCELFSRDPVYSWNPDCMLVQTTCVGWDSCPEGR